MKKTIQKLLSVALATSMLSISSISASATEYAYSIGHDFGMDVPLVSDYEGDFTENVNYASTTMTLRKKLCTILLIPYIRLTTLMA